MSEEEDIQQIKEWWQRNGMPLLLGGALALAGVSGWNWWHSQQSAKAEQASQAYQQLITASLQSEPVDTATVSKLTDLLNQHFADSRYAVYASLLEVKVAVDTGHMADAEAKLRSLMGQQLEPGLAEVVRQRLARVLAAQDKPADALQLLTGDAVPAFVASREELRGDLLVKLDRKAEARSAYQKARAALPADAGLGVLQTKLDDLADKEA